MLEDYHHSNYHHSNRCALDVMRLVELLLVLMLEGRKALPKAIQPLVSRRMENFLGDRSHRHVIEAIRSGNNDEFFEAMEGGVVCQCVTNECCQCVYSQGLTSTLWMMLVKHC